MKKEVRLEQKRIRKLQSPVWMILLVLLFLVFGSHTAWGVPDDGFRKLDGTWYHFDLYGKPDTGWKLFDGVWYFFDPSYGAGEGKMMTGWQWIDGACYYLEETEKNLPGNHSPGNGHSCGSMYAGERTPDGYLVGDQGMWVDEKGKIQLNPHRGIWSRENKRAQTVRKGGAGTGAGTGTSHVKGPVIEDFENEDSVVNISTPAEAHRQYAYTIRYMDLKNHAVLSVAAGQGNRGDIIELICPELENYRVCGGQKDHFSLSSDAMEINVYYDRLTPASPSEPRKVGWSISFVSQDPPNSRIFKTQNGQSVEGTEIVVDFPETILGTDGFYYNSVCSSPCTILITGAGVQKYDIVYRKGDPAEPEENPDQEAGERLSGWIQTAAEADLLITGTEPSIQQLITDTQEASNERMKNLVSAVDDSGRHEFYLIGRGHIPNSMILGRVFSNVTNLSELMVDTFAIDGAEYNIMRIGFRKVFEAESCSHRLVIRDLVPAGCLSDGHETVSCGKCGFEETVILPAVGHRDQDGDGICDVCFEGMDGTEVPDPVHYDIGDLQVRRIGDKLYLFRCIDDDYRDAMDNSRHTALFLCDTVIRSDTAETSGQVKKLRYGADNNYKHSEIRAWLNSNASDSLFATAVSYTGIQTAYRGSTRTGDFEQFDETGLVAYEKPFQLMEDKIFLLSMEEAVKYRDFLWKFNGSSENNPQTQYSVYSRGYYLRSPQYAGNSIFRYGSGIYAVDLGGSLRPVNTGSRDIGIRPVMSVIQD